jgi:hypothetical protein
MQVQFDDIASGKPLLRQVREEQFVDDACTCDADWTLLLPGGVGGHDHAAGGSLGSHRDLRAIVEAAHHWAFRALLELIRGQVQLRLNQRMIEQAIVFPTGHKHEPSYIGEHGPVAVLPVEACAAVRSGGRWWAVRYRPMAEIPWRSSSRYRPFPRLPKLPSH